MHRHFYTHCLKWASWHQSWVVGRRHSPPFQRDRNESSASKVCWSGLPHHWLAELDLRSSPLNPKYRTLPFPCLCSRLLPRAEHFKVLKCSFNSSGSLFPRKMNFIQSLQFPKFSFWLKIFWFCYKNHA